MSDTECGEYVMCVVKMQKGNMGRALRVVVVSI